MAERKKRMLRAEGREQSHFSAEFPLGVSDSSKLPSATHFFFHQSPSVSLCGVSPSSCWKWMWGGSERSHLTPQPPPVPALRHGWMDGWTPRAGHQDLLSLPFPGLEHMDVMETPGLWVAWQRHRDKGERL